MHSDPQLQAAIDLAVKHHAGQFRKHEIKGVYLPAITHPMQVMSALWKWGVGTSDNLRAAVCHDILEDTTCTGRELRDAIGLTAATIVEELTFLPPKDADKAEAKDSYLRGFASKSLDALYIKMADRICNVLDFYPFQPDYALVYFHKADVVFTAFYDRFRQVQEASGPEAYDTIAKGIRNMEALLHKGEVNFE